MTTGPPTAAGVVTKRSAHNTETTVRRVVRWLDEHDVTVFCIVDHDGEARALGLTMNSTKLIIFGNPAAGTPIMNSAPLVALDLPLKLLVWDNDDGTTSVSYTTPAYLADRHHLTTESVQALSTIELVSDVAVAS